jgi:hypothetical protein
MVARPFDQPFAENGIDKLSGSPVVEQLRRGCRLVAKIDLDGVALAGPDARAVLADRKSALIVVGDDVVELLM